MADLIDLSPKLLDLVIYAGDGVVLRLDVQTPDGQPMDLTGVIDAQVRVRRDDLLPTGQFSATSDTPGVVLLQMSGQDTAALINGETTFKGVWDVQWTADGAEPVTLMQGKLTCKLDVTRV